MLTKDLIRFTYRSERIKPSFIPTDNAELLTQAKSLLNFYNPELQPIRSQLEAEAVMFINAQKDIKLTRGLNKLLLDRCDFSQQSELDYPLIRQHVFAESAKILKKCAHMPFTEFDKILRKNCGVDMEIIDQGLYADLPGNDILIKIKDITPKELLERYNCSLVQSLLMHSSSFSLTIKHADAANLRRLFKYMKFFRLLGKIFQTGSGKKLRTVIEIDGPATVLEQTRKYGMQLASFFPAVCQLELWKIEADIYLNNRRMTLKLDQKSALVSHYKHFSAYIPEEIKMFHSLFKEKNIEWEITGNTPLIHLNDQEFIFPDLSFTNKDDTTCHLELFHRWHTHQLKERLNSLNTQNFPNLIIGIDRSIYKKTIKEMIDQNSFFQEHGFLFKDFPGVKTVSTLLKKMSS